MNINELKSRKSELKAAAEKLVNAAMETGKDLAGADLEQYNNHVNEIKSLESLMSRHAELSAIQTPATSTPVVPAVAARANNGEVMAAFDRYLRTGNIQAVTSGLNVGTSTEGGAGVPTDLHPALIQKVNDANVMRQLCSVMSVSHDRTFVSENAMATAAWTAEEAAFNASKPTIASATIKSYKATCIVKVSEELINDSIFDLAGYVVRQGGFAIGSLSEKGFLVGGGTTEPTGCAGSATAGVTTASPTAITSDEIITHFHKLRAVYRNNASWIMKDSTALVLRLLKNAVSGDYLWQPGLQAGAPDRLLGRPVFYSENMDAAAATKRSVLFGDFSYYQVCDRIPAQVQRLNELYAASGQVGFRFQLRTDGALLNAEAVQALVMHA